MMYLGSATNGHGVGAGFDCFIRREDEETVIVNVIALAEKLPSGGCREWLSATDLPPDVDLDALAAEIAQCPGGYIAGEASNEDEDSTAWDRLVERWNDAGNDPDAEGEED